MNKIGDVLRKAVKALKNPSYLDKSKAKQKITPDETELFQYQEKERLSNVKQELERYRKNEHVLNGFHNRERSFLNAGNELMKCGNSFNNTNRKNHLLKQRRLF